MDCATSCSLTTKKPENLIRENGLLKQLTKRLLERALEAEIAATDAVMGEVKAW